MSTSFKSRVASRLVFRAINWVRGSTSAPPYSIDKNIIPLLSTGDEDAWNKLLHKMPFEDQLYAVEELHEKFPNHHFSIGSL